MAHIPLYFPSSPPLLPPQDIPVPVGCWTGLGMICLSSRVSRHRAAWNSKQPKAQRQMATWIWFKDRIVKFESQPQEAARTAQMFPLSFWQRQQEEGKSRGDRKLPESRGERAELLPSRGLHKGLLSLPLAYNMPMESVILGSSTMLAHRPGWLCWNLSLGFHRASPYSQADNTFVCNPGK